MFRTGTIIIVALCLSGCGGGVGAGPSGQNIEVTDAYIVKPAAGRDMTSGGFVAEAYGTNFKLVDVISDNAKRIEMHTMEMTDGKMRMRRVEGFSVTPDEPLTLERGAKHLMLFGVSGDLTIGETVEIELRFDDDSGVEHYIAVDADVIGQGE